MTAIDTEVKEVEKMFAVNVFGPMRMVHFFHPLLVKAGGRYAPSKVVNIGSVGGIVPFVSYSSPIFFLLNHSQIALELILHSGIILCEIVSRQTNTDLPIS